jgi:hypothetical protein
VLWVVPWEIGVCVDGCIEVDNGELSREEVEMMEALVRDLESLS